MAEKSSTNNYFDKAFWATIVLMMLVTLGILITGQIRGFGEPDTASVSQSSPTMPAPPVTPPYEIPKSLLLEMFTAASEAAEQEVLSQLDKQLDELFLPVYAGVTTYANFHYSVLGEYTELTAAVTQSMGDEIEKRMFVGFSQRLEGLGSQIDSDFQQAFEEQLLSRVAADIPDSQRVAGIGAVSQLIIDDVVERSRVSVPIASLSAFASVSALKIFIKNMAQVMAAKVALKFAAKGVLKTGASFGGASSGALFGSALGPVGTILGGIGGAIVTYFAVDAVIINIDQYFNQDEFEAELRLLVASMRESIRADISQALANKKTDIRDFTLNDL